VFQEVDSSFQALNEYLFTPAFSKGATLKKLPRLRRFR